MKNKFITFFTIFTALLIIGVNIYYSHASKKIYEEQTLLSLQQDAKEKKASLDNDFYYAKSSIIQVSNFCSSIMTDPELRNPYEVLSDLALNSPFNFIEYIRWDGLNMMNSTPDGIPFDASNREYYIQGIKGNNGIWPNFKPKLSDDVLLNFYTPLYYDNQIKGVITGAIEGQKALSSYLEATFFNQSIVGFICDENYKVIATTKKAEGIVPGLDLKEFSDNHLISQIIDEKNIIDSSAFIYTENNKRGLCTVSTLESTGWKLVLIVLPKSFDKILSITTIRFYISTILTVLVLMVYILVRLSILRKARSRENEEHINIINSLGKKQLEQQKRMEELIATQTTQISILESMAGIYLTSHLFDLEKDMLIELNTSREVRELTKSNEHAATQMRNIMINTVSSEHVEKVLAFTDLSTIAKRLNKKKIISLEFLGKYNGWVRASFIPVEKKQDGTPTTVLFVTQVIDEEKRREETLISTANKDELTGLYNRHAYEIALVPLKTGPIDPDLYYFSFDVNGLKNVNDNLGHQAGDELLCGAADCLKKTFSDYGVVFRTGGDEYQAIIHSNKDQINHILEKMNEITGNWSGKLVAEVNISTGYVRAGDHPDLSIGEIIKLADQNMYKAKSLFYASKGIDRRGQQVAFEVLSAQYEKILKIDLKNDTYTIIRVNENEKDIRLGFAEKISLWFNNFAESDQIQKSDKDGFIKKTKIERLRNYFLSGKKVFTMHYKRKIDGKFRPVTMEIIAANDFSFENQIVYLFVKEV